MTEPEHDHGTVDTVLQQIHRRCVAQDMECDTLLAQRGAGLPGNSQMLRQQVRQAVVAELAAALVREAWPGRVAAEFVEPGPQRRCGVLSKRSAALGGVPREHSTDNLSAATHERRKTGGRDFNRTYLESFGWIGMR